MVLRFADLWNRDDCGLLLYGWYVSRPQKHFLQICEELHASRSKMLDLKYREAVGT